MNILMVRDNPRDYIARMYWALQEGLRKNCTLTTYGKGQDFYDRGVTSYSQILDLCGEKPDLIITDFSCIRNQFKYRPDTDVSLSFIMGDYWRAPKGETYDRFSHVFCLFYETVKIHEGDERFMFTPPSVDPDQFMDWGLEKEYLVGFLASGCTRKKPFYPERFRLTERLKAAYGDRFFTANHPGWGFFEDHSLVGKGFSQAINRCKMFVVTAGIIGHCNPKYYEVAASGSLLLAQRSLHMERSGFRNRENCVVFDTDDELLDAISHYSKADEERKNIIRRASVLIQSRHTGECRARQILSDLDRKTF